MQTFTVGQNKYGECYILPIAGATEDGSVWHDPNTGAWDTVVIAENEYEANQIAWEMARAYGVAAAQEGA